MQYATTTFIAQGRTNRGDVNPLNYKIYRCGIATNMHLKQNVMFDKNDALPNQPHMLGKVPNRKFFFVKQINQFFSHSHTFLLPYTRLMRRNFQPQHCENNIPTCKSLQTTGAHSSHVLLGKTDLAWVHTKYLS